MAKLNGVKVIEATGGEIKKVAYDGAEYALVGGIGKIGDLAQCNRNHSYFTKGEFYEVTEISGKGDYVHAIDNEGDRYFMDVKDTAKLFRKIKEASELTTKFNVGDVVVTLEECGWARGGQGLMLAGAIGKVKAVDGDLLTVKFNKNQPKGAYTKKADRKNFVVRTSEVRLATAEESASIAKKKAPVIPQVCDVVTFEGFDGEYRKVDRKAQAGDVVVLIGDDLPEWFTKGKAYKVNGNSEITDDSGEYDNYPVYSTKYGRTPQTVDVYEKVEAEYVPQEGDIVVIIANNTLSRNKIGDIGKVGAEKPLEDGGVCVYVPEGPTRCIRTLPSDIRKATPAEAEAYEKAQIKPIKEGDIVVVESLNKLASDGAKVKVGDIGKVGDRGVICPEGAQILVPGRPNHTNYVDLSEVRHATAEEIAQYEKAVADASKPKLKVGNIVKLTKSDRGNVGEYAEIIEVGTFKASTPRGIEDTTYRIRMLTGKDKGAVFAGRDEYYEKATQADVDKALAPKLKAGDFVKFEKPELLDITVGKIYEVQTDDEGDLCIIDDAGDEDYSYLAEFAIKVDADEAKWAQIGRKVGEFRKGDIVRLLDGSGGGLRGFNGIITKIIENDGSFVPYRLEKPDFIDNGADTWCVAESIELIAPVELTLK